MRTFDRPTPVVTGERPGTVNPIGRWPAQLYIAIERVGTGPTWDDMVHVWANGETTGAGYDDEVLADGPVLYLPLQGDGVDVTGNGWDATFTGSPIFTTDLNVPGGQALLLNGTSMWGETADGLEVTTDMTYECWALKTAGTGLYSVISHADFGTPLPFGFDTYGVGGNNKWRAVMTDSGATTHRAVTDPATIVNGQWYHLAGVYDSGLLTLYVDGVAVASSSSGGVGRATGFLPLWLGRYNATYDQLWPGRLAHVAVYQTALSGARIAAHYTAGIT